jgi:hypothetical protein
VENALLYKLPNFELKTKMGTRVIFVSQLCIYRLHLW